MSKKIKTTLLIILGLFVIFLMAKIFFPQKPSEVTLFFGQECPHCKNVEEFIKKNNIDDKVAITRKEVYHDQDNAVELGKVATKCGIDPNSVGVPFLWDGSKCYVGEDKVMEFLLTYVGAKNLSENATPILSTSSTVEIATTTTETSTATTGSSN